MNNEGNIIEPLEENESALSEEETTEELGENEQGVDESLHETEQGEQQNISENEEIGTETTQGETICDHSELLVEMKLLNGHMEALEQQYEAQSVTIWEKPIEEYTVTEGNGLILNLVVIAVVIFALIGGLIR